MDNNRLPRTAILMATYNGEKYLEPQIKSILKQTHTRWELYIQDDLSTDATPEIIARYAALDSRIHLVGNREKHGAKGNFMSLLEKVEADYYMFADQDDVWMEDKVALTLEKMLETERAHPGVAVVVHTDLRVVTADLAPIDDSLWHMLRIDPALLRTFDSLGAHCVATGCTMLINRKAREVSLPMPPQAIMHDAWIVMATLHAGGAIGEVARATMLYRQHGHNTLGADDFRTNYVRNKFLSLRSVIAQNVRYYRMLKQLHYGSVLKYVSQKVRYYRVYNRKHPKQ